MTTTEPTPEAVEELARAVHVLTFPSHADCDPKAYELAEARLYLRAVLAAGYETPAVMKGVMACWRVDMRLAREAEDKVKRVEALLANWRSLPVHPDECGEMVLDGVHRDELLTDLRHALDGTERPRPTRAPKDKRS